MIRLDLSENDVANNMLELANYLAIHEDDANVIDVIVNGNGKSLQMHFEVCIKDNEEKQ